MVYAILNVHIRDPARFREYVRGHLPSIALHGGRVLFRSDENEPVEGTWEPRLLVIHEWPTETAFHDWYDSAEYRPWKSMRPLACDIDLVLMKGMLPTTAASGTG
jgi:uncharacterized protein (DUF1330 family)